MTGRRDLPAQQHVAVEVREHLREDLLPGGAANQGDLPDAGRADHTHPIPVRQLPAQLVRALARLVAATQVLPRGHRRRGLGLAQAVALGLRHCTQGHRGATGANLAGGRRPRGARCAGEGAVGPAGGVSSAGAGAGGSLCSGGCDTDLPSVPGHLLHFDTSDGLRPRDRHFDERRPSPGGVNLHGVAVHALRPPGCSSGCSSIFAIQEELRRCIHRASVCGRCDSSAELGGIDGITLTITGPICLDLRHTPAVVHTACECDAKVRVESSAARLQSNNALCCSGFEECLIRSVVPRSARASWRCTDHFVAESIRPAATHVNVALKRVVRANEV
mmetsp:Transcript_83228/g.222466  ORF Transcript_83228/g.222466 Transcript_83228/m.222466 type:complete len:333 (+) Transcript_83228:1456-2454(+)